VTVVGNVTAEQLKSYVERIERLEVEKSNIGQDIRDVFAEAKGNGYDPKILRKVLKMRSQSASERDEEEHLLDVYLRALGMLPESAE
jgi:uncharacterized protein (UPF0335 family)